jgi:DNA-binding transcriptional regulator YiaG
MRDNRYVRTLQRAVELAGGEEQLASVLRTSREVLSMWLSGRITPPIKPYLAALELVTRNPKSRAAGST